MIETTDRGTSAGLPPSSAASWAHVLRSRLAGLATFTPDGIVTSREGALSDWLPEVGRSCFDSPVLLGFDEDVLALRGDGGSPATLALPGVRLIDAEGAPRCHILISWDAEAGEHAVLTTIDQVDRPIDHWVRQQKREQRLLEERLILASRELERANEGLRQFTSIAAHDLQAPLRQIASFCQVLREALSEPVPAQVSDCLSTIESCAARLTRMIMGLLDHARLSSNQFQFEPVDANAIVAEACQNLHADIVGCAAVIEADPLPRLVGSPVLLVNLFQNLIANSLRYRSAETPPRVAITAFGEAGAETGIAVSDNGIGVPPHYGEAIFGSFVRVPRSQPEGSGAGLGLGICRRIADMHGWKLALDPSYTSGARFCIGFQPVQAPRAPGSDDGSGFAPNPGARDDLRSVHRDQMAVARRPSPTLHEDQR